MAFDHGSAPPANASEVRRALVYQVALVRLCDEVNAAMETGRITPRDDLLGLRIAAPAPPAFEQWRHAHAEWKVIESPDAAAPLLAALPSSNEKLFPGVLVDPLEFSEWARAEGLARQGEIEGLIATPSSNGGTEPPASSNRTEALWKITAKKYADEIYRREQELNCDPSRSWIAGEIARRFHEEDIQGRKGRLDAAYIVRHGLAGWRKSRS